jgi:hypothetical protein
MDTLVWSMKVMATAHILAASATVCCDIVREGDAGPPRPGRVLLTLSVCARLCHDASEDSSVPGVAAIPPKGPHGNPSAV